MFRSRKSFLKSLLEPFTFCGLCANSRIKTSVAKNYDKRNEINRYRIPDLSEYTINIGFSLSEYMDRNIWAEVMWSCI